MAAIQVDLGFLDECEPWLLSNKFFPSKVGGLPAWLDVDSIPSNDIVKCSICNETLLFLCQVYAPLEEFEQCFHRMLYVFICKDGDCWKANSADTVKIFRCQLPRQNKFYSFDPPSEEVKSEGVPTSLKLCQVCGCRGPLSCSQCKLANYCSASHQKIDWTFGEHKAQCKTSTPKIGNDKHGFLLKEFELVIEPEEVASNDTDNERDEADVDEDADDDDDDEQRRVQNYEEYVKEHETASDLKDVPAEEFEKYVSQCDDDEGFQKFSKRVKNEPEQVVRFCRSGAPLWITNKNVPAPNAIPPCDRCQTSRVFEFQIMPQLLNSLSTLTVDWGVISIFTCKNSCDTNGAYVTEYCYKQDICNTTDE